MSSEIAPHATPGGVQVTPGDCQVQSVEWRGRRLEFRRPLECKAYREESLFVIEQELLGILAYSETAEQAWRDFAEECLVIWEDYGLAPDEELAPSGRRLKGRLQEVVLRETGVDAA